MKPIHIRLGKVLKNVGHWTDYETENCKTHLGLEAVNQLDLLMKVHMLLIIHFEATGPVSILKENQASYFKRKKTFDLRIIVVSTVWTGV